MEYADVHFHGLCHADDGAKNTKEMYAMLETEYQSGIRTVCFTPHYHPGYFGDNREISEKMFEKAKRYCAEQYPDMILSLGNELRYVNGCVSWLKEGNCRTYPNSRYVLVDFSEGEEKNVILQGIRELFNAGYHPVLAHVERYRSLWREYGEIKMLAEDGVLLQLDSQSLTGKFGMRVRFQSRALLSRGLADLISSDAHDLSDRPPGFSEAAEYISGKMGKECKNLLCRENALHILRGEILPRRLY